MSKYEALVLKYDRQSNTYNYDFTVARAEVDKLTWMLDTYLRHGDKYRQQRAGFADFFALIWEDLEADYGDRFDDGQL